MLRGLPFALVAAATLVAAPARAHHSFAVHFVALRLVTVHGTVDECRPGEHVYPHYSDPSYGE
jgi:hypothetical protein